MTRTRLLAALAAGVTLAGVGTAAAFADDTPRPVPAVSTVADVPTAPLTTTTITSAPLRVDDHGGDHRVRGGDDRFGDDRNGPGRQGGHHGVDDGPGHDAGDDHGGDR